MPEVTWTSIAVEQLDAIETYIARFDPIAARRMVVRLAALGDSLASAPHRGRPIGARYRELVAVRPYILRYRVEGDQVFITRIRHSARAADPE